jgi:hypothetical protein
MRRRLRSDKGEEGRGKEGERERERKNCVIS